MIFVAMTAIIGYRAFGKQIRCRMGIATTALDLDGKEVNACDDGAALAQNGPSGNGSGNSNGPNGPTATINCNACKVKNPDGTPGCFVAGTPIMTEDGLRPIETITTGTVVLTRDQFGGEQEWRPVLRTVVHRVHALVRLTIVNSIGATDTLVATPDHPLQSLERGWVVAAELVPGRDHLLDAAGEQLDLVDGESLAAEVPVYNFAVEGTHTYFVGRLAVWAHNSDPCTAATPGLGDDHGGPSISKSSGSASGSGEGSSSATPDRGDEVFSQSFWEQQLKDQDKNNGTKIYTSTQGTAYWKGKDNKSPPPTRTLQDVVKGGPGLLSDIAKAGQSNPTQISVYRGMKDSEAQAIKTWFDSDARKNVDSLVADGGGELGPSEISKQIKTDGAPGIIPIGAHLGDYNQAKDYAKDSDTETIVQITLKPGAGDVLFNPKNTVLGDSGSATAVINEVYKGSNSGSSDPAEGSSSGGGGGGKKPKPKPGGKPTKPAKPAKGGGGGGYHTVNGAEGSKAGYIGLKSESKGYFSISLGTTQASPSNLLFQQYIHSITLLPKNGHRPPPQPE